MFASPDMNGKQPYWPESMLKCYVQPAAKRVGITKVLGWHSFRRTFATLLPGNAEDVKTVQELMPSMVTSKPAMRDHFKTGHGRPGTLDVVPVARFSGKSHF